MANRISQITSRIASLSVGQKLALAAGVMAAAAILFSATQSVRGKDDWKVLFANVAERDGSAIIASLQQMNVPYRFTEGGGAILVPSGVVHETRLKLAGQGLPKAGTIGFEVLENQKLGTSQFVEQVNYQRGLEGELAKSIQGLAQVERARVHLAIPKASAFVREQQQPSASVVLTMHPGRFLDDQQVVAITHLVSSSVPQLAPQAVTIVDANGGLLAPNPQRASASGLDATQLKYVNEMESAFVKRIVSILEPIAGRDNVRAQVAVDVDFSQVEVTEEKFRPNSPPNQAAIRSQQSLESAGGQTMPGGVPGALSNQPPPAGLAPLDALPAPGGTSATALPRPSSSTRKEQTTNYEVDRAIQHTKNGRGQLKRVSAAVIVNYRSVPDKDGVPKAQAFSAEDMQQINSLVRDTMGFSKDRGDSVSVANIPFNTPAVEEIPFYKQPENIDLAKEGLKFALLAITILAVVWGVIRPLLFPRQKPGAAGAGAGEAMAAAELSTAEIAMAQRDLARERRLLFEQERAAREEERKRLESDLRRIEEEKRREYDALLEYAKQYVGKDTRVVASIVKDWLGPDQPPAKT